ncbi:MAG: glycine-rich domain-containing protein [Patescibacteria group bacterium]
MQRLKSLGRYKIYKLTKNKTMKKTKILITVILGLAISGGAVWAVVQSLNGQSGQTQTFGNDSNITINSASDVHSLSWYGHLPISRGGTGNGSFADGSILFASGASISQDNSNLFWNNTNKRLGIGTNTPSSTVDVQGNIEVTQVISNTITASGSNQSISLNPTGTGKVLVGGGSIVVASRSSEPSSPVAGQIYFDSTLGKFRGYNGTAWVAFSTSAATTIKVLVVAGGGGGASNPGGGGAGGLLYDSTHNVTAQAYTVTIGSGGSGNNGAATKGSNGGNSVFDTMTAIGGGGGGGYSGASSNYLGQNGGSGGGGGDNGSDVGQVGGTGTSGQGYGGGSAYGASQATRGGGGGGSGAAGANATSGNAGNGGAGTADASVGNLLSDASAGVGGYITGGGGGGYDSRLGGAAGSGGSGGGGAGADGGTATAGTANTGSGGGGAGYTSGYGIGGDGGSGIVIISYPTGSMTATGGTITTSGGNTIHKFTSSGTFTVTSI